MQFIGENIMARQKTASATMGEFISQEEAERMAQVAAGRALAASMPEPEPEIQPEDDPDDIALANVIADLGGPGIDAKVNVYHLDGNRNKAFARAYLPAEFSLESVQQEFGPGDYEIHVRKDGKLATRKVLRIAAPKNQPVNSAPNSGMETARVIEAMQNGFKEMGTMFATALAGLASNQPKPKTTMEMLQEMQLMREIMGVNNAPVAPSSDPMHVMELAMNLAEKIQPRVGEPGTGEVIMEAIKNFGPMLAQGMQNAPRPVMIPQLSQNPVPAPSQITPAQEIQAPITQPVMEDNQMNIARKYYMNLLIANAEADNDPTTYAQLMIDLVGENAATEFVNAPDWFEKLCAEEPRAQNHKVWFDEMRGIIQELTKPDEPAIDKDSKPEQVPNVP